MTMATVLPLSELTALLSRELAESATAAERRQRDSYVALAAEFAGSIESYRERVIGATAAEQRARASGVLDAVVAPAQTRLAAADPKLLVLDDEQRARLVNELDAPGTLFEKALSDGAERWVTRREAIEALAIEKLQRAADARYRDARALLASGMPKTQIRGGKLEVKVVVRESEGTVVASLADAQTAAGLVSTLTVDFHLGAFPAIDPQ